VQIKTVFRNAVERLIKAEIPDPELEASLLLAHVLHMARTELLLAGGKSLTADQMKLFDVLIARRLNREPLAYIIGEKEFWSLSFTVSKDVLIPRPETEFLLEQFLTALKSLSDRPGQKNRILDLGTGSGVIAVIIALELKNATVTAVDCSYRALQVARHNAKKHKVAARIDFINSSWFDAIASKPRFDAVISNPPYIASEILSQKSGDTTGSLQPEVGMFEPRLALDGGSRGIQIIRGISAELGTVLKSGGWFFMEIGADQKNEVMDIFRETAAYDCLSIVNDYAGLPRVFRARKRRDSR
jgi:release factor glutamine methyltransferase